MNVIFVGYGGFGNFDKLSRAIAVTIEDLMVHTGLTHLTLASLDNNKLHNMLIQYVDSTKKILSQNGLSLSVARSTVDPENFADPKDTARVVTLGIIGFVPHRNFVKQAKSDGIDVLEF